MTLVAAAVSKAYASESGHYYDWYGEPRYTVVGANGNERNTTVRDAKKYGWVPSYSTVARAAAKPGLDSWLRTQWALQAYTMPIIQGETAEEWFRRVEDGAREQSRQAMDRGTYIHGGLEAAFQGRSVPGDIYEIVRAGVCCVEASCGDQAWCAEKSFAHPEGYGGKVDLHCGQYVLDFKTKDNVTSDAKLWDEHYMQLAAYRHGLGLQDAQCGIVYVDRDRPFATLVWAEEEALQQGLEMFRALLRYWMVKNRYFPRPPVPAAA